MTLYKRCLYCHRWQFTYQNKRYCDRSCATKHQHAKKEAREPRMEWPQRLRCGAVEEGGMKEVTIETTAKRSAALRKQWADRRRYHHTTETDAVIRTAYHQLRDFQNRKALASAAKKLGWPIHTIRQRGQDLGLAQTKESPWSVQEEQILEDWGFLCDDRIAKKLKEHGFHRTATAVHLKTKRLRIRTSLDGYTMRKLAEWMNVDDHKIATWINRGMLKSEATGIVVGQNEKAFISRDAVRKFILNHPDEVDIGRCEKFWLLGVLCPKDLCADWRAEAA